MTDAFIIYYFNSSVLRTFKIFLLPSKLETSLHSYFTITEWKSLEGLGELEEKLKISKRKWKMKHGSKSVEALC